MSEHAPLDFSVVVCAYTEDRWDDLTRALDSVRQQTFAPRETIVVCDHNEQLRARAAQAFAWARVIENAGQQGLSDARNSGVQASSGSAIAFLDDDAVASPEWLAVMRDAFADAKVIGVGGAVIPAWDTGRPAWFPEEFDWVVGCSYRGLPTQVAPVRNPLGCNMAFRREAFEATGGFDTSVGRVGRRPVGGEETEFCIRLRQRLPDRQILYHPAAAVSHRVPAVRTTWRYFRSRCYAEGVSKARITFLVGAAGGLASERRHAALTLPMGVLRNLATTLRSPHRQGPLRAGSIAAGLAFTVAGYVAGRASVSRVRKHRDPARSADAAQ
jgi:glucosyl-dolichyl phosphate glucuronosyltransferase